MALYVASWTEGAGKTTVCVGLGRWLQKSGRKVAYLKPVALADAGVDGDAGSLRQVLGLGALSPLRLSSNALKAEASSGSLGGKVAEAYGGVLQDHDAVLLEGAGGIGMDADLAQAAIPVIEAMDASVIVVVAYSTSLPWEKVAAEVGKFGRRLVGIVINRVPGNRIESVRDEVGSLLDGKGVEVVGVLPEDRLLMGVNVAQIAERLQAQVLCCADALNELVENVMIGALTVDSGADYFDRKDNKAVITRGERPDTQIAALATSTRCLILSGGVRPIGQVLSWAEDKRVPVLVTDKDTLSAVAEVEQVFAQARFNEEGKLEKLEQMLQEGLDFSFLSRVT